MRSYGQSTDGMTYKSTANLVFSQSTKCRQQANSSTPYRLNSHRTYPHYIPLQPALQGFLVFIACLFWTKLRLGECRGKVFFYYAEPKQVRRRQQQPMCYVSSVTVFMIAQHYILSCYGFFQCERSCQRVCESLLAHTTSAAEVRRRQRLRHEAIYKDRQNDKKYPQDRRFTGSPGDLLCLVIKPLLQSQHCRCS